MLDSTLALAFLESGDALGILLASSPLVGALSFNASLGVSNSSNGLFNSVEAVVVNNAFPESAGCWVSLLGDAVAPASLVVVAFVLTILESSEAGRVL